MMKLPGAHRRVPRSPSDDLKTFATAGKPLNCSGPSVVVASKFLRVRAYSWPRASSPNVVRAPAAMASKVDMSAKA